MFFLSGSVMHYPKGAFGIDPSVPVITALIGNPVIGQKAAFSEVYRLDLKYLSLNFKMDKHYFSIFTNSLT